MVLGLISFISTDAKKEIVVWIICSWWIKEWKMCADVFICVLWEVWVVWENIQDSWVERKVSMCFCAVHFITTKSADTKLAFKPENATWMPLWDLDNNNISSQYRACTFSPPSKSHQRLQVEVLHLVSWPFHPWNNMRDFAGIIVSFLFDYLKVVYRSDLTSLALWRKDLR